MVVFCVKMTSDYFKTLNGYSKVRYLDKIKVINNQDPCSLLKKDFSANIKDFPDVSYMDMVNYLVYGVSHYTSEDLKAYKSIQSYNLFKCGWVSDVYIKVFPGMHLVIGKGLVALVTGGASGLGRATAERLVRHGGKVLICDLPTSSGSVVSKTLGENCIYAPADVSSESDVQKALDTLVSKFQKLDVVVNCAAISVAFKIFNFNYDKPHKLSDMEKVMKVNASGTFNVNRLAVKLLSKNDPDENGQRGVIINTSAAAAFEGIIGQSVYASSTRAVASMTLPMARDLASHGIRCCTIAPGFMETELNSTLPSDVVSFISDATPFPKRFGRPEEYAHLVQCVIENSMLNGEVLRLDGGIRFHL